jgi:hypothetical protein
MWVRSQLNPQNGDEYCLMQKEIFLKKLTPTPFPRKKVAKYTWHGYCVKASRCYAG